jgi:hypothetical protein
MICTTLNKIRAYTPCSDEWKKLLAGLNKTNPDDEPLPMVTILDLNGLEDALWALRTTDCEREELLLAVAYARQVQHLMTDERSVSCLEVAERFANKQASAEELDAATLDAERAAWAAEELAAAARAAWAAARAAGAATWDAERAAAYAAGAAGAAGDAAARDTMREKQVELFKEILG